MDLLTHSLISEITGDKLVTAVYGGGFKPPTKGHLEVVQKALSDFPEIDKFIIYVGQGERNGITQSESILIWEIYKKYLPSKVEIQPSKAPIGDIFRYAKNNPEEIVYFIIGAREGNEGDLQDISQRTTGVEDKYSNLKVKVIQTADSGISGTKAREASKNSPESFYQFLPPNLTDSEKLEIFGYIQDVVTELKLPKVSDIKEKFKIFVSNLKQEGKETKAAFALLIKAAKGEIELTDLDKQQIKEQLKDIIKGVFGAAVFALPAGGLVLLLLKLIKLHGLITPSAFLEENDPEDGKAAPYGSGYNKLNENASYSKDINIEEKIIQLTQHMLDKGYNIEPLPAVEFIDGDSENAREFLGKTAYYNPETQTIVLYTEGRHPKDIVRSFSHEMVHHIQNLEGRLGNITTTNTQEDDNLNDIEAEANLKGTMTFRNWTDSLNEAIVGDKIECDGCGWSWKIVDGGDDLFICHKCGHDNSPLNEAKPYKHKHGFDDKLGKDPFGLNQFAREIAEEVISEGRYDSLSRELASITINSWKSDFKDREKYGYFEGKITPEEYPTDLTFIFKALGKFVDGDYTHNGYSRSDGEVGVKYEIPKDAIPQIWEEVYMDLISTIRHEIEHQTQGGKNVKPGKGMASDQKLRKLIQKGGSDVVRYVTLPKEIESNVQGLYLKAKKWRRSYNEVADEYIRDFLKITNPADVSYVKNKWQEVAKKRNLPNLLNEGRYDTLANKLSSIAFEAFKDIHDRGDKEGSFEFRVDHPDEEHDIPSKDFFFDFAGKVEITDDEYGVDGGANAGFDNEGEEITPLLSVKFKIPKNPDWQKISFDIKDVVRHELEHLTQDGYNEKTGKYMEDDQLLRDLIDADLLSKSQYFKLEKEVDAMLQGLYFKAKKAKRPFKDVINDYLNIFIDQETITQEEKEEILDIWRSRGKALSLPVFEQIKDMDYEIYSDMDGVLTDFDASFMKASDGILPSEYEKNFGKDGFWELIDGKGVGYWVGMPWMSDGKQYWDYIKEYKPILLSSPSRSQTSRLGKRLWVRNNLPGTKLILAQAKDKQNYAQKNRILIDDRPSNIDQWRASGGVGILHISAADTIRQLKELGL